jgi:hypothetical protein
MRGKKIYEHFIRTDWHGIATKIKNLKKKTQRKKNEKI